MREVFANHPPAESHGKYVCTDGLTYTGQRDPPGQFSVYIPPGEEWRENYRCSTYARFPTDVPLSVKELARSGFLYTGYKDRVRCFSCGICVENWMMGDDPADARWHKSDCRFALGVDTTNIPITSFLSALRNTVATSHSSRNTALSQPYCANSISGNVNQQLANTGTALSHEAQPTSGNAVSVSRPVDTRQGLPNTSIATAANYDELFACDSPVNPHMRSLATRIGTFQPGCGTEWDERTTRVTSAQIAEAGFYFLGERDRTKCWYCNGGLQNWEYNDDPWFEHAKWFPSCEFVLSRKGIDYVQSITDQFPNLERPQISASQITVRHNGDRGAQTRNAVIVDPRVEMRERDEKISAEMGRSSVVQQAIAMGYTEDAVKAALAKTYDLTKSFHKSTETLLDDLTLVSSAQEAVNGPNSAESMDLEASSSSSLVDRLKTLETSHNCRICKEHASDVVMVPCGHLASCFPCAKHVTFCPICKASVRERIKAFRA